MTITHDMTHHQIHITHERVMSLSEAQKPARELDGTFRPLSPPPPTAAATAAEGGGREMRVEDGQLVVAEVETEYEDLLPWPQRQERLQKRAEDAALELRQFEVVCVKEGGRDRGRALEKRARARVSECE